GFRQHGSISSNASNRGSGRPKKGIRMAGRYGAELVTALNLDVVRIDSEKNLVLVRGAVPGPNGGVVSIRARNRKGQFIKKPFQPPWGTFPTCPQSGTLKTSPTRLNTPSIRPSSAGSLH